MTRFPQTLVNVHVKDKHAVDGNAAVPPPWPPPRRSWAIPAACCCARSGTEPVRARHGGGRRAPRRPTAMRSAIAAVVEREV